MDPILSHGITHYYQCSTGFSIMEWRCISIKNSQTHPKQYSYQIRYTPVNIGRGSSSEEELRSSLLTITRLWKGKFARASWDLDQIRKFKIVPGSGKLYIMGRSAILRYISNHDRLKHGSWTNQRSSSNDAERQSNSGFTIVLEIYGWIEDCISVSSRRVSKWKNAMPVI